LLTLQVASVIRGGSVPEWPRNGTLGLPHGYRVQQPNFSQNFGQILHCVRAADCSTLCPAV